MTGNRCDSQRQARAVPMPARALLYRASPRGDVSGPQRSVDDRVLPVDGIEHHVRRVAAEVVVLELGRRMVEIHAGAIATRAVALEAGVVEDHPRISAWRDAEVDHVVYPRIAQRGDRAAVSGGCAVADERAVLDGGLYIVRGGPEPADRRRGSVQDGSAITTQRAIVHEHGVAYVRVAVHVRDERAAAESEVDPAYVRGSGRLGIMDGEIAVRDICYELAVCDRRGEERD